MLVRIKGVPLALKTKTNKKVAPGWARNSLKPKTKALIKGEGFSFIWYNYLYEKIQS